jgi:hypothetical protein
MQDLGDSRASGKKKVPPIQDPFNKVFSNQPATRNLPNMKKLDSNQYVPKDLGTVEDEDLRSNDSSEEETTSRKKV